MLFFKKKSENKTSVKVNEDVQKAAYSSGEDELIAVISAAVTAYLGSGFRVANISESGITVRSLRAGEPTGIWVQHARIRNIQSK